MLKASSLAFVLLTIVSAQVASDGARIDGFLIDGGAEIKLDHVLVVQHGNEEGLEDGPHLRIFLTSGAIPLSLAGAATTLDAGLFAKQSKIYGVVILADPSGKTTKAVAYRLNTPPWKTQAPPGFAAKMPDPDILRRFQITGSHVSGEVHVDLTRGWVTANFDTTITPDPVTQDLADNAAIESAPAKAFLAYQEAASRGDMAGLGKYSTSLHEKMVRALHDQMGNTAFIRFVTSDVNMKALPNSILRVVVRGDSASIVFKVKEVATLVLEGNVWKVNS